MTRMQRLVLTLSSTVALATLGALATSAHAQESASAYPSRAIRFIVPSGPGGVLDLMGRATAESMAKTLGQPVFVENKPGASATMTGVTLALSKPDGYTIGLISCATLKMPHISKASYDPMKDLTYLGRTSGTQLMVAVKADAPWTTLAELVADSKKPSNKYFFGGPGSTRLFGAQLADASNVASWSYVPYRGDNETLLALLAGDVPFAVVSNTVIPMVKDKRVRVLAVFGSKKIKGHEDVPTLKELGYTTIDDCPMGVTGPKGMDPAIVAKLEAAVKAAVTSPILQSTSDKLSMPLEFVDAMTFTTAVREGFQRDQALVKKIGITPE
jgi:tripartite-type tricarboxylate transporter receptor subunit TctC